MNHSQTETGIASRDWYVPLYFVFATLLYQLVNFQRQSVPGSIFNELQADLQADAAQIASLSAWMVIAYAVSQIFVGFLNDRFGGFRLILAGAIGMTAGSFLFAFGNSLPVLYAARFLTGLSCGCVYLSIVKSCDFYYPKNFTSVLSIVILFGYCGGVFASAPLSWAVGCFGWRPCFAVIAILIAVLTVGFLWLRRKLPSEPIRPAVFSAGAVAGVLLERRMLVFCLSYGNMFGLFYAMMLAVGKKFLEEVGGMSSSHAAICCGCIVIVYATASRIAGIMPRRFGGRLVPVMRILLGAGLAGFLSIFLLMCMKPEEPAFGGLFFISMVVSAILLGMTPICATFMRGYFPPNRFGLAMGIINCVAYIFTSLYTYLAGALLNLYAEQAVVKADGAMIYPEKAYLMLFGIIAFMGICACCIALAVREPQPNKENSSAGRMA